MSTETKVKERPILFSGPMVRAILEGRKTQTRRVIKPKHEFFVDDGQDGTNRVYHPCYVTGEPEPEEILCPYGSIGERLWVRETFRQTIDNKSLYVVQYQADQAIRCALYDNSGEGDPVGTGAHKDPLQGVGKPGPPYKPSIHMPRWASRIMLEITGVRVERLNDISEADALAEGIERRNVSWNPEAQEYKYYGWLEKLDQWSCSPVYSYESLWESINGVGSWAVNPWVWVVEFKRIGSL